MLVEVHDDSLAVSWQRVPPHVHAELVESMKYITGASFDARAKCWRVPLRQADRVYAALPAASYSYDAISAAVAAEVGRTDRFMRNLCALGVQFEVRDGQVLALGPHVSPLVQQLVAGRNDAALAWLSEHPVEPASAPAAPNQPLPDGETWHQAALLATSLRNAAKNQQRKQQWKPQRQN